MCNEHRRAAALGRSRPTSPSGESRDGFRKAPYLQFVGTLAQSDNSARELLKPSPAGTFDVQRM
jgi:hypothetical protein